MVGLRALGRLEYQEPEATKYQISKGWALSGIPRRVGKMRCSGSPRVPPHDGSCDLRLGQLQGRAGARALVTSQVAVLLFSRLSWSGDRDGWPRSPIKA